MTVTVTQTSPAQQRDTTIARVLIVDDHSSFADLLAMALNTQSDFECVGTAANCATAVDLAIRTQPDIVIMDIQLGAESGLGAMRCIREVLPESVIVVVSAHRDPSWVVKAAQAGASAYAPKSGLLSEMLSVLRGAKKGSMLVAPSVFQHMATKIPRPVKTTEKMTVRERDVLVLMGKGVAPAEMSRLLNISVNTCRGYVKAIHTKLGVRSQLEAVVKAQRLGLITLNDDE